MEENEFTEDERKILREVVEREKTIAKIWSWIRSFVLFAVPVSALYTFWEHFRVKG